MSHPTPTELVSNSSNADVTAIIRESSAKGERVMDSIFPVVYKELRSLAHKVKSGEITNELTTGALVHEAYLKLVPNGDMVWNDRIHFYRTAAKAMRQILIDEARRRKRAKRGGGSIDTTYVDDFFQDEMTPERVIELDEALTNLEKISAREADVVKYRFYAGLSIDETARTLGISEMSVKRDWRRAKAKLFLALDSN